MRIPASQCPVAAATEMIGGKWKARIIWALIRGEPQRFSSLRRACPPISDRILSKELKELAASGLVHRREDPGVPPRTEYTLTALGRTLEPVMAAMAAWALAQQSGQEPPPSL